MNSRPEPSQAETQVSRAAVTAVVALTLIALLLRLHGIGFGLPTAVEQDCKIPYQVELLRRSDDTWRRDEEFRWYPLLIAHLAKSWPETTHAPADAPLAQHLTAASLPQEQVRITVALLAVLIVPGTYVLARIFLGRGWSLFAAALVTFSLLDVSFSQQSRPHAVAGALFLGAVLGAVRMRRKGDVLGYSLAGGGVSLAIGCLQSGVATLPAILVAHFARRTRKPRWFDPQALLVLFGIALAVPFFYPFALWGYDTQKAVSGRVVEHFLELHWSPRAELDMGGHRFYLDELRGEGARIVFRSLWSYEPVLLGLLALAAVLGLLRLWLRDGATRDDDFRRQRDTWVVLGFALPYLLVIALYSRTYERFVVPLLPYFAVAAALGVAELTRRVRVLARPAVAVSLALALVALPAWASWKLGAIRAAPSTNALAANWVSTHLSADDDVALWPNLDLPLCRKPEGFKSWMGPIEKQVTWVWSRYQATLPDGHGPEPLFRLRWWAPALRATPEWPHGQMVDDPSGYIRAQGGDWIVAEVYAENRTHPGATRVRDTLRKEAQMVERISPDGTPDYSEHPLGSQDETSVVAPNFFARVLQARASGPVIEIYKLK